MRPVRGRCVAVMAVTSYVVRGGMIARSCSAYDLKSSRPRWNRDAVAVMTGWREPAPASAAAASAADRRKRSSGHRANRLRPLPGALAGEDIRKHCGAQVPGCGWLEP